MAMLADDPASRPTAAECAQALSSAQFSTPLAAGSVGDWRHAWVNLARRPSPWPGCGHRGAERRPDNGHFRWRGRPVAQHGPPTFGRGALNRRRRRRNRRHGGRCCSPGRSPRGGSARLPQVSAPRGYPAQARRNPPAYAAAAVPVASASASPLRRPPQSTPWSCFPPPPPRFRPTPVPPGGLPRLRLPVGFPLGLDDRLPVTVVGEHPDGQHPGQHPGQCAGQHPGQCAGLELAGPGACPRRDRHEFPPGAAAAAERRVHGRGRAHPTGECKVGQHEPLQARAAVAGQRPSPSSTVREPAV